MKSIDYINCRQLGKTRLVTYELTGEDIYEVS